MTEVIQDTQQQDVFVFPTSYAQQRLWFMDQFEPNSPFYNIPSAVRFKGLLIVKALENSINEIVRRHETLRTTFAKVDGKPVQVIHPFSPITIPQKSLRNLPKDKREAEAIRLATLEARKPFNLSKGPLIRFSLLELDDNDHVVMFTMHHIISDGWSMSILIKEIAILYDAFSKAEPLPLPELPIQYADFAMWQQEWLTGEVLEKQMNYWENQLNGRNGKLQVLELSTDRPRPAVQTSNGDSVDVLLPRSLGDSLKTLSSKEGVTFFMTLLAAFQILLYRYTGQEDICVGSPIANRTRAEIEALIGFFVNTLVLRTDLSGDPTFRELLKRVKEVTLGAYANQDIPFERLVELIQPERDMSHSPLFQVMFILQNNPINGELQLPDIKMSTLNINPGTSTFDLTLMVAEQINGLSISAEYNTDLFDEVTIVRILDYFQVLLEGIVINPDERISRLPLLPEKERHKILVEWNNYKVNYSRGLCIHHLFEAQVEFTPDAIAVAYDGKYLTYRELNERANQLAHYLRNLGITMETLVGICIDKSLELIVGVMGTIKSGGAYVPIDPTYPKERIAHMIEDANVFVLLTQERIVADLPDHSAEVICLDSDWEKISHESTKVPTLNVTSDNLVYVIYTSGSTGKSKGVMVMHRTLVNAYKAWEETFRLRTDVSSHLQMASFSFDVFSGDFVRALCSGGKLVLVQKEWLLEAEKLYTLMVKEKVDIAEFVPAVLRNLVQYLDETGQNLEFMRLLIAGSDVWFVGEYKKFLKFCSSNTRLLNTFGLTEATIDSAYFERRILNLSLERLVPIGIPFNNTEIYILDAQMQPVPIGVPGELCVGGAGLARGYLNRPALTAEKFISNPFSNRTGDRLYRTGDRARFLADGNIEFLGRIDDQVKIRGFRIELGEIESVLEKHENVKEAVITTREDTPGNKRLVAYIVTSNGVQPTTTEFHGFLKEQLPDYMVPSFFVFLEAMPLTPNGKIDRRALPAPDQESAAVSAVEFVAPRTPTEEVLAKIWTQILGTERVGVNNNFFELGGHSLLATQLVSRIRDAFEVELPLRNIFEFPFVGELAKKIDIALLSDYGLEAPPIQLISRDQELPLSFAQQRLWFLDQLEPDSPFYNIPEALRFIGALDIPALEQTINEIVRRHESLRTTFHAKDGRPYQMIHPEMTISLKKVDIRGIPKDDREEEIRRITAQEAQQPFDLTTGPLLRAILVQVDSEEYVALYTMHHIIGDDWSSNVLFQEIAFCYDAFTHGRPSPLPEPSIQYADYAYWQQQWLQGEVLEKQLNYWKKQVGGAPQMLELPTDRPRPPVQTYNGSFESFEFSESLMKGIKDLSNKEGATLFMTLLAAFQTLLYRYSGQDDICVGSPIANRTKAEMENLIGFFVNTLVLRTDLSGNPSFKELLKRVREVALGAYAHQDLPFEKLVDAIQPHRDMSHSPLFQVMFVIQNSPKQAVDVSGMTMAPVESHSGTAKFDLTLFMLEEGRKLSGALEYNTDLFDNITINRMLKHFENLLKEIIANPEQKIAAIPILTEAEKQQAIVEWNATSQFVHKLFEIQVNKMPEAPAVIFGEELLNYEELNQSANQLAHHLQSCGIGPEILVGICMERSLEMMVGLLGVLKAGGAYVPIDPSYPPERIAYMIEDSNVALLLTQERLKSTLPENTVPIICLDTEWGSITNESDENLSLNLAMENLAYVIYTSGSTGKPKGTLISHQSLMNYLNWCLKTYPLKEGRGSLVHSSLAFDATITGLYAPLLAGSSVYLVPETKDIEVITAALRNYKNFSIVKITPAHLQMLGEQMSSDEAAELVKAFIIGGENLTTDHIAFWQKNVPDTKLINEYGPTETVVGCMNYETPVDRQKLGSVPIGFPIDNMQTYLLDTLLQPMPIGVAGEMYIGGVGVARGYLNRPDLTAEKFIPDPFSQEPGARLYKSGDLARYLADGNIEFLGRIDHQVKIRGFRIELGEIEAVLGQHPSIRELVVLPWEAEPEGSDVRLVAYIVPDGDPMPSTTELREFLKGKLPDYMIPANYIKLDALPLTPNGKVDRKALPKPDSERPDLENIYIAPHTQVEKKLAEIWSQVIGIDKIGIHDNFFDLGGDSILSIQVISRANQAGIHLTPKQIFQMPTIAELAQVAAIETSIQAEQTLVMGLAPLTPIQHWFFEQNLPQPDHWNQSIMFEVRQKIKPDLLKLAIQHLIRHHDALRLRFKNIELEWQAEYANIDDVIPFNWIDLSNLLESNHQSSMVESIAEQLQASLNLAKGPMIRVALFDLGTQQNSRLLIVIHHLVMDGVSWQILLEDLHTAYLHLSQGNTLKLPFKTTSFKYWAEKLLEHAKSEEMQQELNYWLTVVNSDFSPIPVDYPEGANIEHSAEIVSASLSVEETNTLLHDVPSIYRTQINDVLLTAIVQSIKDWTGSDSVLIDLEGHGREDLFEDVDISRTVGWFTTVFPVMLELENTFSPGEALKSIKEQLRRIPNRGIGYGILNYLCQNEQITEQLKNLPQSEVNFNYLGQFDQAISHLSILSPAQESRGPDRSPQGYRSHVLEISGSVMNGQLQMMWIYSKNIHKQITIEKLADSFMEKLRSIITHCQSTDEIGFSETDFEDFEWSQDDIDDIVGEITQLEG